jgi:hypothetical protein
MDNKISSVISLATMCLGVDIGEKCFNYIFMTGELFYRHFDGNFSP